MTRNGDGSSHATTSSSAARSSSTAATFESDGDLNQYGGEAVHLAARIGAAAGGGEILVSRESLDDVRSGLRLSEPRSEAVKGFDDPVEVVSVDWR